MKILLVEDNEQLNKALSTVLKRNSFMVVFALMGKRLCCCLRITVVILDIMIPRINGFEVLKKGEGQQYPDAYPHLKRGILYPFLQKGGFGIVSFHR